jgi:hypothetical protein
MCWLLVVAGVALGVFHPAPIPMVVVAGLEGFCTQPALPLRSKDIQLLLALVALGN